MRPGKAVTLRLDPDDYERLEAEATRLGLRAGTLVRVYVRAGLNHSETETETQRRQRVGHQALADFSRLRAELRREGYPSVDAVKIMEENRVELEERPYL